MPQHMKKKFRKPLRMMIDFEINLKLIKFSIHLEW